jgi:hypothetical protein
LLLGASTTALPPVPKPSNNKDDDSDSGDDDESPNPLPISTSSTSFSSTASGTADEPPGAGGDSVIAHASVSELPPPLPDDILSG